MRSSSPATPIRAVATVAGLVMVMGCGGKRVPCSGSTCVDVAGDYDVRATSPASGNTCKHIVYVVSGNADGSFAAPFHIDQSGSDLTFSFAGGGIGFNVHGTLFEDHSASFTEHIPDVGVTDPSTDEVWDYADDTDVELTFTNGVADGGFGVVGSMHDTLSALSGGVPDDAACSLSATLSQSTF